MCAKPDGRRCNCGLRGCVEAYAGRGALEERARKESRKRKTVLFDLQRKRGRDRLTSGVWLRALDAGDEVARDLLERGRRGAGRRDRLGGDAARRRGGGARRRARRAARAALARRGSSAPARRTRSSATRRSTGSRSSATSAERSARACSSGESRCSSPARPAGSAPPSSSALPPTASPSSVRTSRSQTSRSTSATRRLDRGGRVLVDGGRAVGARQLRGAHGCPRPLRDRAGRVGRRPRRRTSRGPFLGLRAIAPLLAAQGSGRIVNVSSDSAFKGRGVVGAHYAASKAALCR